ncbi:MAG: 4-(cytidine 5'-diphospho)-2-C-methyl-D-erythritol kinase [Actinomycetes bacterium]
MKTITASAPAKVNLIFEVGKLESTGFHNVNSLFLGLDLREEVQISVGAPGTGVTIFVSGENLPIRHISAVPTDGSNLVAKVAKLLSQKLGISIPDIQIDILKRIPVAGGMAGGSADAAAMLVAFNEYAHQNLGTRNLGKVELLEIASELGSDISFSLMGELAIGTGKGDQLQALPALPFSTHWVIAISQEGLSTPSVYVKFDELGTASTFSDLVSVSEGIANSAELAGLLHNDLELAAIALVPQLENLKAVIEELGALRALVSGSGPTIAALCSSKEQAESIAKTLTAQGIFAVTARSPAHGANLDL